MQLEEAFGLASIMLVVGFFLGSWWSYRRHAPIRLKLAYLESGRGWKRFEVDDEPDSWTIQ